MTDMQCLYDGMQAKRHRTLATLQGQVFIIGVNDSPKPSRLLCEHGTQWCCHACMAVGGGAWARAAAHSIDSVLAAQSCLAFWHAHTLQQAAGGVRMVFDNVWNRPCFNL